MKEIKDLAFRTQAPSNSNPTWDLELLRVQRSNTLNMDFQTLYIQTLEHRLLSDFGDLIS